MRQISPIFLNDLKSGKLRFVLDRVLTSPDAFALEIRGGYINLYYRGGNALKVTEKRKGYYFKFDEKYALNADRRQVLRGMDRYDLDAWEASLPSLIDDMDAWFSKRPKPERAWQQKILAANQDNFRIVDIEYAVHKSNLGNGNGCRLDMLALARLGERVKLVIIEYKKGINALSGNAGLAKHQLDILQVIQSPDVFRELRDSMHQINRAKEQLGIFKPMQLPVSPDDLDVEVLFLLSDYNPNSIKLQQEVDKMNPNLPTWLLDLDKGETTIDYSKAVRLI